MGFQRLQVKEAREQHHTGSKTVCDAWWSAVRSLLTVPSSQNWRFWNVRPPSSPSTLCVYITLITNYWSTNTTTASSRAVLRGIRSCLQLKVWLPPISPNEIFGECNWTSGVKIYWLYIGFMPKLHILLHDRQNLPSDRPPLVIAGLNALMQMVIMHFVSERQSKTAGCQFRYSQKVPPN